MRNYGYIYFLFFLQIWLATLWPVKLFLIDEYSMKKRDSWNDSSLDANSGGRFRLGALTNVQRLSLTNFIPGCNSFMKHHPFEKKCHSCHCNKNMPLRLLILLKQTQSHENTSTLDKLQDPADPVPSKDTPRPRQLKARKRMSKVWWIAIEMRV